MTPSELKEILTEQYKETVENLSRIEGAIAACNKLLEITETEPTVEDEATDD